LFVVLDLDVPLENENLKYQENGLKSSPSNEWLDFFIYMLNPFISGEVNLYTKTW